MVNYLNLSSYTIPFNPLEVDTKKEVSKVSKEILSIASAEIPTENLFAKTNVAPIDETRNSSTINAIAPNPSISKINNVQAAISPIAEKVSAYQPVENTNINMSAVQKPITYDISRQVAATQAGFGVNLSQDAQKAINSLNVNAMPYNKPVKTEEVMNGKIFIPEMKTQEEMKNIFVVPNVIKTFETLATNLDAKKKSEGFSSSNKGNNERQFKQKNSLNLSI